MRSPDSFGTQDTEIDAGAQANEAGQAGQTVETSGKGPSRGRLFKVLSGVGLVGAIAAGFLFTRDQQADPVATEEKGEKSSDMPGSAADTVNTTELDGLVGDTMATVQTALAENNVEAPKVSETNGDSGVKDSEGKKEAATSEGSNEGVEASKTPNGQQSEVDGTVVKVVKATTAEGAELVGVIVTAAPVADTTTSNDSKAETVIYGTPRRPDGDLSKAPLRDENGDIIIDCPTGAEKDKTDPFGIRCQTTGSNEEKK